MTDRAARAMAAQGLKRTGPYAYNTDIGLRRWRVALAKVKAGTNQLINVSVVGDSISEGAYSGGGATAGPASAWQANGWVGRVRSGLAGKYGDVGHGFIPTYYPYGAPLWTFTGPGWADNNSYGTTRRSKSTAGSGDTATLSFSGTGIGIVVAEASDSGTLTYSIDGGAATTLDTSSASTIAAAAVEVAGLTSGSHMLTITKSSDAKPIYLLGAYPIKGAAGVRVNMVGRFGVQSYDCCLATALPAQIDLWNPALTIIALTANDYGSQETFANYRFYLQLIISRALTYGDVLLVSAGLRTEVKPIPQSEYVKIMKDLAMLNSVAFIDLFNRWSGDANYANTTLNVLADSVHPNDFGHQDMATAILNVLLEDR